MVAVRRPRHLFFALENQECLDLAAFLQGSVVKESSPRLSAISVLTGKQALISPSEVSMFAGIDPQQWTPLSQIESRFAVSHERLDELASKGLLIFDVEGEPYRRLRQREDRLANMPWHPFSLLFHATSRWQDVDDRDSLGTDADEFAVDSFEDLTEIFGPAPQHFYSRADHKGTVALSLRRSADPFFELLAQRKTTREFESETQLDFEHFSTIMRQTFGCHGYERVTDDLVIVKKTSPSGGALHSVEVYPLVIKVDRVQPGIYHYNTGEHSLEALELLDTAMARDLATEFCAGQGYFGSAHVLLILTSRFGRHFWKYRKHRKAYKGVLMDAAHLSQTLYLVCAHLGLGAFTTVGVNDANIDEALGLNFDEEGTIAVCGFGNISTKPHKLGFDPDPYFPRRNSV